MAGATVMRLAYAALLALAASPLWLPIPVALQMTGLCLLLIYIGCRNSLDLAVSAKRAAGQQQDGEGSTDEDADQEALAEAPPKLEAREVYMFPVMGSCVLFGLYLTYKFLPPAWINRLVKAYFFVFGALVLGARIAAIVELFAPRALVKAMKRVRVQLRVPMWRWIGYLFEEEVKPKGKKAVSKKSGAKDKASAEASKVAEEVKESPESPSSRNQDAEQPELPPGTFRLTALDLIGFLAGLGIGVWYLASNHWLASNMLGMAFSLQALEWIHLGAYFHGFFLLAGLCVYDIFWVFGTDVMVTVARSFDGPIKLLFPQPHSTAQSMLGLGDIVIPGIVISFMLKFDYQMFAERCRAALVASLASAEQSGNAGGKRAAVVADADKDKDAGDSQEAKEAALKKAQRHYPDPEEAPTPYFYASLVCYTLGLITTLAVMYTFHAAQPALLYLSPAGIISSIGFAAVRGEFRKLWSFKLEDDEEDEDEGEGEGNQDGKEGPGKEAPVEASASSVKAGKQD